MARCWASRSGRHRSNALVVVLSVSLTSLTGCSSQSSENVSLTPGQEVVVQMIEAHGGLETWRAAPTVSYEAALQVGPMPPMVSRGIVEQRTRRAHLEFPEMNARILWDGERAWSENWHAPLPPRFYALHSYYFMNLPWLTADPGVMLGDPGTGRLLADPTEYITVKMTFEPGVGDTPDDSYTLYIDPKSYRLRAIELVVTYADFRSPLGDPSAPIVFLYEEFATVDGLTVPTKSSIHLQDGTPMGSYEWRDWSFSKSFDESRMVMSSDAVLDDSSPTRTAAQ